MNEVDEGAHAPELLVTHAVDQQYRRIQLAPRGEALYRKSGPTAQFAHNGAPLPF